MGWPRRRPERQAKDKAAARGLNHLLLGTTISTSAGLERAASRSTLFCPVYHSGGVLI